MCCFAIVFNCQLTPVSSFACNRLIKRAPRPKQRRMKTGCPQRCQLCKKTSIQLRLGIPQGQTSREQSGKVWVGARRPPGRNEVQSWDHHLLE